MEHAHSCSKINSTRIQCTYANSILKVAVCISVSCKPQPKFHQRLFTQLTDPMSDRPETWPSGGSRHSKCPQSHFHALNVKATRDGQVTHAVDLAIRFGVDPIPNYRLRLISLGAATHAEITGADENPLATTSTLAGPALSFLKKSKRSNRVWMTRRKVSLLI